MWVQGCKPADFRVRELGGRYDKIRLFGLATYQFIIVIWAISEKKVENKQQKPCIYLYTFLNHPFQFTILHGPTFLYLHMNFCSPAIKTKKNRKCEKVKVLNFNHSFTYVLSH